MTEIDTGTEIDIVWQGRQATVSMPLTGNVPREWRDRYDALARREGLEAQAQEHPERTWIVVTIPAVAGRSDLTATLDSARDLIAQADTAEEAPDAEEAAAVIRQWWAEQRN